MRSVQQPIFIRHVTPFIDMVLEASFPNSLFSFFGVKL
jgi:hypothetical protein